MENGATSGRSNTASNYTYTNRQKTRQKENLINDRYFKNAFRSSISGTEKKRRGSSLQHNTDVVETPSKRVSLAQQLMANKSRMMAIRE